MSGEYQQTNLINRALDEMIEIGRQAAVLKDREQQKERRLTELEKLFAQLQQEMATVRSEVSSNSGRIEEMSATQNRSSITNTQDNSSRNSVALVLAGFAAVVLLGAILYGAYVSWQDESGNKLDIRPSTSSEVSDD